TGPITGVFGSQRIYNGEPRRPHYGVDVAAPTGTPIVAPQAGIVTLAHSDMFFEGGLIFLDHGHGVTSVIMHMSRVDVTEGQAVARGDVLGAVGATGRATGPHLHWGMFWRGAQVDPVNLVGAMPEEKATATGGN
ncbi:MAG: M23 family metallopeptidase, partial [Parvibaculum sp.]|nr:M23 family metallopeptidase [Parvibaculum sp.]